MGRRDADPPIREREPRRADLLQRGVSVWAQCARIHSLTLNLPADKDATDYFRGVLKTGEMSPRVLSLTERIIRMNPAHYTAW